MFEKYTEKARRVIFFARYESSQVGSPFIESEHLLLGLIRESRALFKHMLGTPAAVDALKVQVEQRQPRRTERISSSVDLPLSEECKRVLANAATESDRLGHQHIGTEHLLLGLLAVEDSFAAKMLTKHGLTLALAREKAKTVPSEAQPSGFADWARYLMPVALEFVDTTGIRVGLVKHALRGVPRIGEEIVLKNKNRAYRVCDVAYVYLESPWDLGQETTQQLAQVIVRVAPIDKPSTATTHNS